MLSRGPNVLQKSLAGLRCVEVMPKKKQRISKGAEYFQENHES